MAKLTKKQLRFCEEYVVDFNATQAAIRAGYSKKTANRIASQNLSKLDIQEKIKILQSQVSEKADSDAQEVIRKFEQIARANILNYGQIIEGKFKLYNSDAWTEEQAYAIQEIKTGKDGITIKFHDKQKALENLGRVHGIYEQDNRQGNQLIIYDVSEPTLRSERNEK